MLDPTIAGSVPYSQAREQAEQIGQGSVAMQPRGVSSSGKQQQTLTHSHWRQAMPPTATGPPTTLTLDDAIAQLDATLTSHFDSLDQADAPTAELEQVAAVIKQARELMPSNG